jgi:hypothetical protein
MDQPQTPPTQPQPPQRPLKEESPRHFELYAQNVNFDNNAWDLTLLFSMLNRNQGGARFIQIGAIHIPWSQAKLMLFYLTVNIMFHELEHGPIQIPKGMAPGPPEDLQRFLPDTEDTHRMIARLKRIAHEIGLNLAEAPAS